MKNRRIAEVLVLFACLSVLALPMLNNLLIAPAFTRFLENVGEGELVKVASQMTADFEFAGDLDHTVALPPDFLAKIESERELLNLTKIKLFTRGGLIVYSTDAEDIGTRTSKDFFSALVQKREARTDLVKEYAGAEGREVFLVETYVPIIKQGRTIGVFEIYYDMTETGQSLTQLVKTINMVVFAVSLVLLFAVLSSAYFTRRSQLLREQTEAEKDALINDLADALSEINALRGILPLCSFCKKIRDDSGYWEQVDVYIDQNSAADISHSICPDCLSENYPEEFTEMQQQKLADQSGESMDAS